MDDLPQFERWPMSRVQFLAADVFMGQLVRLESFDDGHYRAVFRRGYFHLEEGQEPSKSQWNTLKKRFKRRHRNIFVFRTYGPLEADGNNSEYYYMDFGFLRV
ncbi:MAG: hypothetical protein RML73_08840 [Anaerolineae bacterium]|nr:hypothetical protein [Anaerolineae bacterium]